MGLLAVVSSRVRHLGLFKWFVAALPIFSLLVSVGGIAWLAVLPMDGQFRNSYISENALLPHQASTYYRESEWNILRGYREQVRQWKDLPRDEWMPHMSALLEEIGLATDTTTETVYGILHAPRGSHNEAIVVVAPWIGMDGEFNDGALALIVGLSRFFKRWSIWQKNLVFVIPENGHVALRDWVEAYHTSLQHTAGSVEGAVVLDYTSRAEHFDHIEVLYEGFNGQLPNLDLVNTAVSVCHGEWVNAQTGGASGTGSAHNTWERRMRALVSGIMDQVVAGSRPNPNQEPGSAMFSGWRIDAVTIRAVDFGFYDITTFGRIVESTVRSLNNLLEHFHQSFFFYLMLGPQYFVSIATYLPAAMLVANAFSLMALYIVLASRDICIGDYAWAGAALGGLWLISAACAQIALDSHIGWLMVPVLTAFIVNFRMSKTVREALHAEALAVLGLALTTLAMINFGLALAIGLAAVPLPWLRPRRKGLANALLLSLSCPLVVLLGVAGYSRLPLTSVISGIVAGYRHLNVWTGTILACIWFPGWVVSLAAAM